MKEVYGNVLPDDAMAKVVPCLLVLLLSAPSVAFRSQSGGVGKVAIYEAVIDRLFAARTEPASDVVYKIRYVFGEKTEFQIRASELGEHSGFHVGRWRVRRGAPSLYEQLDRLTEKQPAISIESAASSISVEYDEVEISRTGAPANVLRRVHSLTIPAVGLNTIELHGALIRFSLRSPGRDMDLRVWAPRALDRDKDAFVQWMIDVRTTFEALDFSVFSKRRH